MAVNCSTPPTATLGLVGVTAIPVKVALDTVRLACPDTLPEVAAIVVIPAPTPVATPLLAIVATVPLDELHVTRVVISWLVPSE